MTPAPETEAGARRRESGDYSAGYRLDIGKQESLPKPRK